MARELKEIIVRDLTAGFNGIESCILVGYQGLNSEQTLELRSILQKADVEFTVVHNRLARRAFEAHGAPEAFRKLLRGPTAVVYGNKDGALSASKQIVEWRKKNKDLAAIKGGVYAGRVLEASDVEKLATIPDADTLRAQVMSMMLAPLTHLASVTQSLLNHFVSAAKAHREGLEKQG